MSRNPNSSDLLADVLAEMEPDGFRETLLAATLRRVDRRRRIRRGRLIVGAVAVVVGALMLILTRIGHDGVSGLRPTTRNYELVTTQPLPTSMVVATQAFDRERWIVSTSSVPVVRTKLGGGAIRLLNDNELLALANDSQPAVLVRLGPNVQELIFVRRSQQDDLRRQ